MIQWLKKIARYNSDGQATSDAWANLGGGTFKGEAILFARPRVNNVRKKNRKQIDRGRGLQPDN